MLRDSDETFQVGKVFTIARNGHEAPGISAATGYIMNVTGDAYEFVEE